MAKNSKKYIQEKIHKKIENVPTEKFEDANMLDLLSKVNECTERGYGVYGGISLIFTFFVPYIVLLTAYFYSVLKSLTLITLIIIFTQLMIYAFKYKFSVKMEEETMNLKRKIVEYESYLYDIRYYKDTLLYGSFDVFLNKCRLMVKKYNNLVMKYEKKQLIINLFTKVITLLGYITIFYVLFINLIVRRITIGSFAAIFSCLGVLFFMIDGLLTVPLKRLSDALANVKYYYDFMHMDFESPDVIDKEINSIKLENVCFQYPNMSEDILNDVSLEINRNEIVVLVGPNGSGKSTLAKILVGLYSPTSGKYFINGCDDSYEKGFRGQFTAALQNFQKYKMTLRENVQIGDFSKNEDIKEYLEQLKLNLVNKGIDEETILSREFGGTDLSGGEWQKLAIVRSIYKDHSVIVLDEPTASIDPIEENHIYKLLLNNERGKIVIMLTHRIGAARYADKIVVLNKGKIEEVGKHAELINRNGLYSVLYNEQAKWYI